MLCLLVVHLTKMESRLFVSRAISKHCYHAVSFRINELAKHVQAVQLVKDVKADNIFSILAGNSYCSLGGAVSPTELGGTPIRQGALAAIYPP